MLVPLECSQFTDEGCEELEIIDRSMNPEECYEQREGDKIVAATIGGMAPPQPRSDRDVRIPGTALHASSHSAESSALYGQITYVSL